MSGPSDPARRRHTVLTGAAGFLGSHLADALIAQGHRVTGLDNLLTGRRANVAHLPSADFTLREHDVTRPIEVSGPVDYVIHGASPASPVDYLEWPIETLLVGSRGTHHALGLARATQATFLLLSTSEVYGDPLEHPQCESYWGHVNPIGPRSVYDEAKRFAEALTMAYHRQYGVETRIARLFNTFGPRMAAHDGRAVPTFVRQALTGAALTVFGDGSQTRSLCYVSDVVDGLLRLLTSPVVPPVNLGNPHEISMRALAETIRRLTGSTSPLTYAPAPVDDPKQRRPDITRAETHLGWTPRVALETGLTWTIQAARATLGLGDTPAPTAAPGRQP